MAKAKRARAAASGGDGGKQQQQQQQRPPAKKKQKIRQLITKAPLHRILAAHTGALDAAPARADIPLRLRPKGPAVCLVQAEALAFTHSIVVQALKRKRAVAEQYQRTHGGKCGSCKVRIKDVGNLFATPRLAFLQTLPPAVIRPVDLKALPPTKPPPVSTAGTASVP